MTANTGSNAQVKPFAIKFPQSALDDLQERLKRTRWPDELPGAGWTLGTNLAFMKEMATYWLNTFDWRKQEASLNQFKQFTAEVNGVTVHFIHERGKGANPTPILLLHGWPDSFYRYHKLIPMLTDPASFGGDPSLSFDVIVPSLPGFGFSERMALSYDANADLFVKLMTEVLGYDKFVSAGGDGGSMISVAIAQKHPDVLRGIYLTDVGYPDQNTDFASLTPAEQQFAGFIQQWWMQEGAFNMIQATKPQSLAYSMNDSPVGLAAWIISMMMTGSKEDHFRQRFPFDELLPNISIYWLTETINSTFRMYSTQTQTAPLPYADKRPDVPAAVAHCPWDAPLPREWANRKVNLQHFTVWEAPELIAADVRDFVRQLAE